MIETVYGAPTRAENHYPERVTTVSDEFLKDVAGSLSTRDECFRAINVIVGRMAIIATDELRLQSLGEGPLMPEKKCDCFDCELARRDGKASCGPHSSSLKIRLQVGEVSAIPVKQQRILRATWALVERYFSKSEHRDWTQADLDMAASEIATEYQVGPTWVLVAMFGKIVQTR